LPEGDFGITTTICPTRRSERTLFSGNSGFEQITTAGARTSDSRRRRSRIGETLPRISATAGGCAPDFGASTAGHWGSDM